MVFVPHCLAYFPPFKVKQTNRPLENNQGISVKLAIVNKELVIYLERRS